MPKLHLSVQHVWTWRWTRLLDHAGPTFKHLSAKGSLIIIVSGKAKRVVAQVSIVKSSAKDVCSWRFPINIPLRTHENPMKPTFSTGVSTPLDGVTCDLTRATGWMYITLAKGQATLQNTLHSGTADVRQRVGQDRGKVSNSHKRDKLLIWRFPKSLEVPPKSSKITTILVLKPMVLGIHLKTPPFKFTPLARSDGSVTMRGVRHTGPILLNWRQPNNQAWNPMGKHVVSLQASTSQTNP